MPVEVILPMLGETMDEGTIVKWFAEVGDPVHKGEPLYQVETDKAALDVEAPASGTLRRIIHDRGAKVKVLSMVGLIGAPDEDVRAWGPSLPVQPVIRSLSVEPSSAASPALSRLGRRRQDEGIRRDALVLPQSSRPAEGPGTLRETGSSRGRANDAAEPANQAPEEERVFASPRARKLAAGRGVDISYVTGTGPGGRVVEKDVLAHVTTQPAMTPVARKMATDAGLDVSQLGGVGDRRRITKADLEVSLAKASPPRIDAGPPAPDEGPTLSTLEPEIQALTGLRGIIAQRMSASAHTTARVTLTTEVDAVELTRLQTLLRESLETALGFAVSYSDILVVVVSRALREYPYMNVRLTDGGIRTLPQVNVGVAVDTDRGLLVPVIRDADRKGIAEVARVFRELVARARAGKSTPDDLTGGTFTVTNLGMFDIDAFTPIINPPECAILGVGRIQERPAVHAGQICVRQLMVLSLTFDHRVVDGAPAARFLQRIKQLIEAPALLLA